MTRPRIGIVGSQSLNLPADAERFGDLAGLLSAPTVDMVVLDQPAELTGAMLTRLRQHPDYAARLIYTRPHTDPLCLALGDGPPPPDPQQFLAAWEHWAGRFAHLEETFAESRFEARVLSWLWLHPHGRLIALRDAAAPQCYRYPLLEALDPELSHKPLTWLQLMRQQGWLEEDGLVDRIRLCPDCGSGRLNFVDVCGECQSIDIVREHALHCFTCGHVGPQARFMKNSVLVCPNCLTRLRHIGSDYDRPMENYRCRACDAFFVDARVEAHCLACGAAHATDQLQVREIRHYRLSEAGRLRCRQRDFAPPGREDAADGQHMIGEQAFNVLLDWQIDLVRRHGAPDFSVVGLRFAHLPEMLARLGRDRTHALIDGVVERLREQLRDTDRCTRVSEELLWVMLPHTGEIGRRRLVERLGTLETLFAGGHGGAFGVQVSAIHAPAGLLENEDATLLLARLASDLA